MMKDNNNKEEPQPQEFKLRLINIKNGVHVAEGNIADILYFSIHLINDDPEKDGVALVHIVDGVQIPVVIGSTPIITGKQTSYTNPLMIPNYGGAIKH